MRKVLVTIIGQDRPGIVRQVAQILTDFKCNIVEVSQTTLLGEFAGLFSTEVPMETKLEDLSHDLELGLESSGLAFWVKDFSTDVKIKSPESEPYVLTLRGPDRLGLIPEFASTIAAFEVNIDNLRAVSLSSDLESEIKPVVLVFEVSVPKDVNQMAFRQALAFTAEELSMELSLQHRDIFEAIHRL